MQPSLVPAGLVQNTTPGSTLIRLEIYISHLTLWPLGAPQRSARESYRTQRERETRAATYSEAIKGS